ncbi:MAG: sialate O-acetylesterase [Prevotella sp.]|nr:sialate O-acetylesterase [Prevotella sp.]
MKTNIKSFIALFAACLLCVPCRAEVRLPMVFADGMVLQQQSAVRLWGWCESFYKGVPGRQVTVTTSWDGRTYTAVSDSDGRFEVTVQTPCAGGPYEVTFNDGEQRRLRDVLIGEVWLCSGQSNMEMTMKGYKGQPVEGATEELLECGDSLLRLFNVGKAVSLTPHRDVAGLWQKAQTESVRNFSATAYFFGRALRRTLGIPVGLICTAYGGSACEAWMKAEWLESFTGGQKDVSIEGQKDVSTEGQKDDSTEGQKDVSTEGQKDKRVLLPDEQLLKERKQRCPTALYNGQLAPLIGYGIKGVIWYQGEDNVPRYDYYAELLKAMVEGWRNDWQQGEFPFYYCQIAPYDYSLIDWKDSQLLREQQLKAETMIDNARMAVLLDAGLEYGIHPRKKRVAGERLALLALGNSYEVKGLPDFATYSSVEFHGDTAVVAFDRSREWVYFENGPRSNNFEVAGEDRVFHPAETWISRNRVYVRSAEVARPVAVRYAWRDWVVGDLMHDGLPVSSFRTDDW